ncbi:C-type lectin 13 [Arapaima gigas]
MRRQHRGDSIKGGQPLWSPLQHTQHLRLAFTGQSDIIEKDVCRPHFHHIGTFRKAVKVTQESCSSGWTSFQSSCYYTVEGQETSWSGALAECESLGSSLVSIGSKEENDFVRSLGYQPVDDRSFWTGGYNSAGVPTWRWKDGTPFHYYNWATGQPGGSGLNEHCMYVSFKYDASWWSYDCSKKLGFICEAVRH